MRRIFFAVLAGLCAALAPRDAAAKYLMRDLVKAPVDRLIANLERQVQENPNKLQPVYALARVYAMAFAARSDHLQAYKKDGEPYLGVGLESALPPATIEMLNDPKRMEIAAANLKQSVRWYRRAIEIDPGHAPSLLGLAWVLDQSNEKDEALTFYRRAYRAAKDQESESGDIPDLCLTCEAGMTLIYHLDAEKDEAEVAEIRETLKGMKSRPRFVTPIMVALEPGAEFEELAAPEARVRFDLDGSGERAEWGWITPKAAWLVYDEPGEGAVESGLQLFGAVTFWIFWRDGFEALASLDDDGDGALRGGELKGIALWRDANANGLSEPGEVKPLAEWGIEALACEGARESDGMLIQDRGAIMKDGTARVTYDWSPGRHAPASRK